MHKYLPDLEAYNALEGKPFKLEMTFPTQWILVVVLNIIVAGLLIFIGSNLDNCDKLKVPKYDKNDIFNNQGN